jgi:DnaK suppressor protein
VKQSFNFVEILKQKLKRLSIRSKQIKRMSTEKTRYSTEELKEFEELLLNKLESAKVEYQQYLDELTGRKTEVGNTTSGGYYSMENGQESEEKESLNRLAARQSKYIKNLEFALIRIKNGTYGVCSDTGKLISKDRLRAVPHTTQSIEAKLKQNA